MGNTIIRPYEDDAWRPPAPMGRGPGGGPWTAEDERNYQTYMAFDPSVRAWRNGFANKYGEQPNISDDSQFDYRQAYRAGDGPKDYANDTMMHWGSSGKRANHPTEWMQEFYEQFGGIDPSTLPADKWTPEMQRFMSDQITRFRAKAALDAFGVR